MESKIKIDLDGDNNPIVRIEFKDTEDLRDKVVKKFKEKFGKASNYCLVKFNGDTIEIVPIEPIEMGDISNEMSDRYHTTYPNISKKE